MAELEEKIYESFEAQNEMVRSVLDLLLDTVPVITDATQKIAQAVAGGAAGSMASSEGGEGNGQERGAQIDMGKLSESISGLGKGLAEFNLLAGGGTKFVKFVKSLTNALTRDGEIKDPAAVSTLYTSFGTAITAVGDSLGSIGLGMMVFALADAIGGPTAFTKFFDEFFTDERMTKFGDERATQFGKNLVAIGTSMKTMAITLALLTPAMIIAIPGLLLFAPAMLLVNFVMEKVGSQEGVQAMEGFTKSMTWFGLGLGTFVLAAVLTRFIEPQDLLMVAAITGVYLISSLLFGFVMNEVGESGSESFAKSMAFFSLGLMAFEVAALGTRLLTMADIGKVTLIAMSLTISALLLSAVDDNITKGAEALIMISAALVVAELAVWLIDVLDLKPKSYLIAAGMMTALGLAAIVLGKSGQTVLLGAAATLVLSVSLVVTAFAVKMYEDIEWKTIGKAGAVLGVLSVAAIAVGYAGPLVIAGAAATLVLGAALIVTAQGVREFEDMDSKKIKKNITVLSDVTSIFAKISFISPFVIVGSAAGLAAGAALLVIGHGLKKVLELDIEPDTLVGTEEKPGTIRMILNSVIKPFEDLGKKYAFNSIAAFLGGNNPISDGINMTKGIGDVLCDIAKGVKSFANLQFKNSKGELVTMGDDDFEKVAENLSKVITCVGDAFIEVGKNNQYDLGEIGSDAGTFDKVLHFAEKLTAGNPLQNAIKNFSGIGNILVGIADGLKGFSELKFGGKTFASKDFAIDGPIAKNISMAISCVAKAFVDAYKTEIAPNGEGGGIAAAAKNIFSGNWGAALDSLGDNPLEKAIASFSGIAEISSGIIDIVDKLGKNAGKIDSKTISTNISNVISGMTQGLIGINAEKLEDLNARKEYVKDVSSSIVNVAKNSDKLKESADALERISKALDDSFKTIQDLAEEKLTNVKEIFDALVALEEKESDRISDKMEKFGDMANKVGDKKSGSESSSVNTDFSGENSEAQGEKSGNQGEKDKGLTEQLALMNKMLTEINTKLGGTLSVNVDDDGLSSILRRGSY